MAVAIVCLVGTATANAQMAEDVFKNVQVLKGIPVDQFMDTMGFFSASLSLNCTSCHGVESASDAGLSLYQNVFRNSISAFLSASDSPGSPSLAGR